MTATPVRVSAEWLALREPADAAARATELVDAVRPHLPIGTVVIHDLGCGTGSMARWLAPRLAGPQHWVLHEHDADLLAQAVEGMPEEGADGSAVSCGPHKCDISQLAASDFDGAALITASALLDMLTADELHALVAAGMAAGCPVLLTMSVIGRVELTPPDPLDTCIAAAFNDHQRRTTDGRRLLGPDAVGAAVEAFARLGAEVLVRPSPWRLGARSTPLVGEWLAGWLAAAREQRPELGEVTEAYFAHRQAQAMAGLLGVTVHHHDLLARPGAAHG
jgi:hypothetical protein